MEFKTAVTTKQDVTNTVRYMHQIFAVSNTVLGTCSFGEGLYAEN